MRSCRISIINSIGAQVWTADLGNRELRAQLFHLLTSRELAKVNRKGDVGLLPIFLGKIGGLGRWILYRPVVSVIMESSYRALKSFPTIALLSLRLTVACMHGHMPVVNRI